MNSQKVKQQLKVFILFTLAVYFIFSLIARSLPESPVIWGIPLEFVLFTMTLVGIGLFHHSTLKVAALGFIAIVVYKQIFNPDFDLFRYLMGNTNIYDQLLDKDNRSGEWSVLLNLFGLIIGFAILAKHFESSNLPKFLAKILPKGVMGPFTLLSIVFILSSFLDNIAAAMIGGSIAYVVFDKKVSILYIASIVAASNAGGAGSVIGDTTTTMMWIDGIPESIVIYAYIASITAFLIFASVASFVQNKYQPIIKVESSDPIKIDYLRIIIVFIILILAILSNVYYDFPVLGVWAGIFIGSFMRKTDWGEMEQAIPGSLFLILLVLSASMMPVGNLPDPSWETTFALGFISAVFDNIPLTKLALNQGCYDWALLAFSVGFGGSMIWFGSSAGVAITNKFQQARSVVKWVASSWIILVAYIVGFVVMLSINGFEPSDTKKVKISDCECIKTEMPAAEPLQIGPSRR